MVCWTWFCGFCAPWLNAALVMISLLSHGQEHQQCARAPQATCSSAEWQYLFCSAALLCAWLRNNAMTIVSQQIQGVGRAILRTCSVAAGLPSCQAVAAAVSSVVQDVTASCLENMLIHCACHAAVQWRQAQHMYMPDQNTTPIRNHKATWAAPGTDSGG